MIILKYPSVKEALDVTPGGDGNMNRPSRVPLLVAGGGIGGLAAALAVARTGRPVHVLEKASEFGEIGAGLQLAPNALRVLDRLGVLGEVGRYAVYPRRMVLGDIMSGMEITALDLGEKFQARYGYPYLVMHRGDLLDILLAACRATGLVTLETSKEVRAVEDLGGSARVRCADGSVYDCDAVVGADGLWSVARRATIGNDEDPAPSPFVAYRGPVAVSQARRHPFFDDMIVWIGPGMHFVQYLIHYGELYNQVAVFRSSRYREDCGDWGTADELDARFSVTCPVVREAYRHLWRDRRWPVVDRPPAGNWTRNRITLLGDAAHPMYQYLAQGACQALEDAACLAGSLERHSDPGKAFLAYQEARIPRTALVQSTARRIGDVLHADGTSAALRNALLAPHPHDEYSYVDWLYASCASPSVALPWS